MLYFLQKWWITGYPCYLRGKMGIFMLGWLRLVVPGGNKGNFPLRLLRSVVSRGIKANLPLGRNVKEISSGKMPHFPRQLKMPI